MRSSSTGVPASFQRPPLRRSSGARFDHDGALGAEAEVGTAHVEARLDRPFEERAERRERSGERALGLLEVRAERL